MAITKPDMEFIWASGGAIVEPSDTKKQTGWTPEVPPHQWENWIQNRQDTYLAHINERGIPEWDGNTDYLASGLSYVQGSDGKIYKSVAASGPSTTIQDPTTDVSDTYWTIAFADVGAFLTQTAGDARYLQVLNNGSDINNSATFRTNINVYSKSETDSKYLPKEYLLIRDEKAQNTPGGSSISGTQTRTLNTVVANTITGASLSSNRITLPAGTYRVEAWATVRDTDRNRLFLYNVTDAVVQSRGSSEDATTNLNSRSTITDRFTIASSKVFEIRHYTQLAIATNGLGIESNNGGAEIYASVEIIKEA